VIYWELLPKNQTITAAFYCKQLQRLYKALLEKHPGLINRKRVIFHQDNAKPHIAKLTQRKILQLGWELLPHSPYSPDLAPSDYHLFRSLEHHLRAHEFENEEEVQSAIANFISEKPASFFARGIDNLTQR